mgnify:CR=1 FL=1
MIKFEMMKKILYIIAAAAALLLGTSCQKDSDAMAAKLAADWHYTAQENGVTEDVWVSFATDGTFEMYQQVWSFDYELYTGKYVITGDVMTGTYADGSNWACGYKVNVVDGQLTMYSQEDQSVTSLYEKCTIPEEIKAEASTTRAMEVVPFL